MPERDEIRPVAAATPIGTWRHDQPRSSAVVERWHRAVKALLEADPVLTSMEES